jgi:hypothetical protein
MPAIANRIVTDNSPLPDMDHLTDASKEDVYEFVKADKQLRKYNYSCHTNLMDLMACKEPDEVGTMDAGSVSQVLSVLGKKHGRVYGVHITLVEDEKKESKRK